MSVELKPCPFCGSGNLRLQKARVFDANDKLTNDIFYRYECQYCGAWGGGGYTEMSATERWNHRVESQCESAQVSVKSAEAD